MPDIPTIAALLGSVKTATDIARFLRDSDFSLESAELKLKLAELLGTLADAKLELIAVQETLAEKDKRLRELEDAFQRKDDLVRQNDAYYVKDDKGEPIGVPYCLRCWKSDHKQRQLVQKALRIKVCTSCGHQYEGGNAYEIFPSKTHQ